MHMAHGLLGTIKTSLNVVTVSASVKQQHQHSMFASLEQRSYEVQNYQTWHVDKLLIAYFKLCKWSNSKRGIDQSISSSQHGIMKLTENWNII